MRCVRSAQSCAVVVMLLAFAGCGSGGSSKVVTIGPPTASPPTCQGAGIGIDGTSQIREGVCKLRGQTLVVANKGHAVNVGDARIRVLGYEALAKLKEKGATLTPTKHGNTWVVVEFEVTNRSRQVAKPGKQWVIRAGGSNPAGYDANELANGEGTFEKSPSLAPGTTAKGKIVFEMPRKVAADLDRNGNVVVYPLATARKFEKEFLYKPQVAGVIRLYR